jgi:hypothetical protein
MKQSLGETLLGGGRSLKFDDTAKFLADDF